MHINVLVGWRQYHSHSHIVRGKPVTSLFYFIPFGITARPWLNMVGAMANGQVPADSGLFADQNGKMTVFNIPLPRLAEWRERSIGYASPFSHWIAFITIESTAAAVDWWWRISATQPGTGGEAR